MHLIPQCKRVRGPCMRWPDDDRISDLAHEVIVHILSFLSLKEAAKSSTLSRRWRYLWMYTYRRWDFDASKTLFLLPLNGNLRGERYKYVKWVSSVLKLHRSSHLEELRIRFDLSREHSIHMQRWVKFAIEKKVQRFELDLSSTPGDTPYSTHQSSLQPNKFLLPNLGQVIKNPNNLIYSGWDLKIDNGEAPFSQLKSLTLRSVEIYSDAVEYLLSNCPLLEHLCIERSKAMAFKIVGPPSLRLKSLEILHCLRLVQMEIYAPNLESFAYVGNMIQVPFKHVSNSISDLTLGMDYGLSFLSYPKRHVHYFKHVKKLAIDYFGDAVRTSVYYFYMSKFSNFFSPISGTLPLILNINYSYLRNKSIIVLF
ncbi:unnamed protein product [Cuscuta epithymum]|uniref:F-box domain-containing protein n=1 Tax=Cuscuta epithymum TaxID=186058 RepID=A0AAV0E9Z0_9ASTE|nr:unnamed protein product [Cuscuta epithymum]